jgi:hypothetical protein
MTEASFELNLSLLHLLLSQWLSRVSAPERGQLYVIVEEVCWR